MTWKGERQRHAMSARGIKTKTKQQERDEWHNAYNLKLQDLFNPSLSKIEGVIKEAAININHELIMATEYGITDTASNEAVMDYTYRMLQIHLKDLEGKSTKSLEKELIEINTDRDNIYNPFSIFRPYPDDPNKHEYEDWERHSKGIEKVIKKETKKVAKLLYEDKDLGLTSPLALKIVCYHLIYEEKWGVL